MALILKSTPKIPSRLVLAETNPHQLKIFGLDIETLPSDVRTWGIWEQNVLDVIQDGPIISWTLKEVGKKKVTVRALPDYPETWAKNQRDDSALLLDLRDRLNQIDVIGGHNVVDFDIPTIKARWMVNKITPARDCKTLDTLKMLRSECKFKSNKLDDVSRELKLGRKIATMKDLWIRCANGDLKGYREMKRYNRYDVVLWEQLLFKLIDYGNIPANIKKQLAEVRDRNGVQSCY